MRKMDDPGKYHKMLNRKDLLPGVYLRRNHKFHPLVCCVNSMIGLYLAENHKEIPVMISRAHEILLDCSDEERNQEYMKMVMEYLAFMAKYTFSLDLSDEKKGLLPSSLLS